MPNAVQFTNDGEFVCQFSVQWDGGQADAGSFPYRIDLTTLNIPEGTSCWARADIELGPTHDSSQNFNYQAADALLAYYTITGTVDEPSFDLDVEPEDLPTGS